MCTNRGKVKLELGEILFGEKINKVGGLESHVVTYYIQKTYQIALVLVNTFFGKFFLKKFFEYFRDFQVEAKKVGLN